ncbi:hypothetical protein [Streptomyces sp. NPDC057336]|uniref:hypothetical protein n=1 Tax=Streptomyces sp. NPDC057336 TaxID=3346102 RepID=UPI0036256B6E
MAADDETNVPPSGGAGGTDQSPPGAGDATAGLPLPPATGGRDTEGVAGLGVLVADRDGAVATRLAGLLREAGAGDVAHCADQETFLQAVRSDPARWHVALWHEAWSRTPGGGWGCSTPGSGSSPVPRWADHRRPPARAH